MTELPIAECLPPDLLTHDQWVCWQTEDRDGKQTKIPLDPTSGRYASTTDASTWASFEQAREYAVETAAVAGLGFVFTDDDPFVGVDLDNCRETESSVSAWATDVIKRLDSYTEISPSGTGYHIIVTGSLPDGGNRRGDVECYETARYFTMTGVSEHEPPRPIEERTAELAAIHTDYVADEDDAASTEAASVDRQPAATSTNGLDDETVLEKARAASNGPKFGRLWNGSTTDYDSHSEADMALCFHLAFWTAGDTAQMDRLFRHSGLMREKWDEVHFADGSTYGEKTVERAVSRVDEFYEPETAAEHSSGTEAVSASPLDCTGEQSATIQNSVSEHREQRLLDIIDQLEERVDSLEAENEELRAQLEVERQRRDEQDGAEDVGTTESEEDTFWDRVTSRIGNSRQ